MKVLIRLGFGSNNFRKLFNPIFIHPTALPPRPQSVARRLCVCATALVHRLCSWLQFMIGKSNIRCALGSRLATPSTVRTAETRKMAAAWLPLYATCTHISPGSPHTHTHSHTRSHMARNADTRWRRAHFRLMGQ